VHSYWHAWLVDVKFKETKMYTIYTKDNCVLCEQAKDLLTAKGLPFITMKLYEDISRDELLQKFPNARTMPQILKEDSTSALHIGGLAELKKHLFM
jgi:glutaredoxin